MDEFIQLFNRGRYFEAHEVLEELWRKETGEAREFYQGMIQIAAVFVHIQNKNREGAEMLYDKAGRHLQSYAPKFHGILIPELLEEVAGFMDRGQTGLQLRVES